MEVDPGTPAAGRLHSGSRSRSPQTAPNVDFDEFLAGLDAETRSYLQELLAGAAKASGQRRAFSAMLKRFDPTARYSEEIAQRTRDPPREHRALDPQLPPGDAKRSATRTQQLAQLVDASNAVFADVRQGGTERRRARCTCCPARCPRRAWPRQARRSPRTCSGRRCTSCSRSRKRSLPANEATAKLAKETTPIIKNQIRPFAREILPVVNELKPSTKELAEAFPKLATSFSVLNEFFNELAYNPGPKQGRLPVLPGLGQPRPQQRRQHLRRARRARAAA